MVQVVNFLKRDYRNSNMEIGQFLNEYIKIGKYELSVQCSKQHHCLPKDNVFFSDYTSFEVLLDENIPTELLTEWEKYKFHIYMDNSYEVEGLYVFVPKELVEKLIESLYKEIGL